MKDGVVGSVRPRSPGLPGDDPGSSRPSKVQKVTGLRWADKAPTENQEVPAPPPAPRDPVVIRQFDESATSSFTCSSGELLWGHLNTLIEGSKSEGVDTTSGPHETMAEGTILQHNFRYRAKARKGVWKVEPAFIGNWHIGYVCHHEDVDGVDVLRQVAKVGISNANNHKNRDIVYVNRYDWGHWHDPGLQLVLSTLGLQMTEDDVRNMAYASGDDSKAEYFWELISRRFILSDPSGLPTLIQAMKDGEKLKRKNYLFYYPPASTETKRNAEEGKIQNLDSAVEDVPVVTPDAAAPSRSANTGSGMSNCEEAGNGTAGSPKETGNGTEAMKSVAANENLSSPFGVNLVTKNTEYELGWIKFDDGELVGFVYDGEYSALEIYPAGSELKVGGAVAKMDGDDSEEDEDPPYDPSSSTESTESQPDASYCADSETESEAGSQTTSGHTVGSRDMQGGKEEQGEECMSKELPSSAHALETIHEEEDGVEDAAGPSKPSAADGPPVFEDEKVITPDLSGPSSLS
ncbi:hypothetical protein R1flu_009693 [Riccia fluitans]|uniref:Uncharacterized protein n=1 Tax=Riccia fluitans TaxID=41844 RepID=A0ABD1Z378_9MARC